jgi:hypothetical protein
VVILSAVISLLIILALVAVPLALIAKLSLTVLARLLGVASPSEVATRAEFDRIREQLQATADDGGYEPPLEAAPAPTPVAPEWHDCPTCAATVPSTASVCLRCGAGLRVQV